MLPKAILLLILISLSVGCSGDKNETRTESSQHEAFRDNHLSSQTENQNHLHPGTTVKPAPTAPGRTLPDTPLAIDGEAIPTLMLPQKRNLFSLKTAAHKKDQLSALDDDLLTAWQCPMNGNKSPCRFENDFPNTVTVCYVRIFASIGTSHDAFKEQGSIKSVRIHTDKGYFDVSLLHRWNFQYIKIPGCIQTQRMDIEITSLYPMDGATTAHIAEIDFIGTQGIPREPWHFAPENIISRVENGFWMSVTDDPDDTRSQAAPGWLELVDGFGGRKRLMRGHQFAYSGNGAFPIVLNYTAAYCPGSAWFFDAKFTLLDTKNRMMYSIPLPATDGSPSRSRWYEGVSFSTHKKESQYWIDLFDPLGNTRGVLVKVDSHDTEYRVLEKSEAGRLSVGGKDGFEPFSPFSNIGVSTNCRRATPGEIERTFYSVSQSVSNDETHGGENDPWKTPEFVSDAFSCLLKNGGAFIFLENAGPAKDFGFYLAATFSKSDKIIDYIYESGSFVDLPQLRVLSEGRVLMRHRNSIYTVGKNGKFEPTYPHSFLDIPIPAICFDY